MRLQRFKGRDVAEIFRAILDTSQGTDDLDAAGLYTPTTSQNSPVNGEILAGLQVQPAVGSLNVLVSAGVCFLYDPDATPNSDESHYKLVDDPGVGSSIAGTLVMAANSSGQTRVDVVECARTNIGGSGTDQILETDNRDVYNTVTGLFTATTVNKVSDGRLQYRVRAGTPGAGFPGTVAGWMPLAVASVPTSTTVNDTITFWDVRPMMSDRVRAPFNVTRDLPIISGYAQSDASGTFVDVPDSRARAGLTGVVEATAVDFSTTPETPGLHMLGGRLRRGTPGVDNVLGVDGLDLADLTNTDGTIASTTKQAYVYLLTPFNLPRWARYTDATTGVRKPRSPRGIILASATPPVHFWGGPSAPISVASCGFAGGLTQKGVCFMVTGVANYGTVPSPIYAPTNGILEGRVNTSEAFDGLPVAGVISGGGSSIATFTLQDGVTHPAHAKAVTFTVFFNGTIPASNTWDEFGVALYTAAGRMLDDVYSVEYAAPNTTGSAIASHYQFQFRVPLNRGYPSTTPATMKLVCTVLNQSFVAASIYALSWEF